MHLRNNQRGILTKTEMECDIATKLNYSHDRDGLSNIDTAWINNYPVVI